MDEAAIEIASNVATQLVKDSLSSIYEPIAKHITVNRAKFFESFSKYCELVYRRNSQVRTLYSKNKPMLLSQVYVKTAFIQDEKQFDERAVKERFASGDRLIVKGNGGSGKTIFLKHLWITRFENPEGRIPVFVELRRLNDLQTVDLITFCKNELQSDMSFGKGVFEKLCQEGKFEFIFDGFDEVNRDIRRSVEKQILSLSEMYRKCGFLVSGREDDRFSSWNEFEIFTVAPMELPDVRALIEKIPFDGKVKKKFLETLSEIFFHQHQSFLSSPLLAVMMLMTFNENATIPSKLTEFYKSAFQTLLTWHDATKDSFKRSRTLTVDEFRNVFSTFCLISYHEQNYEFAESLLRSYLQKSLDYHSINVDIDDVKNDVCESANLLQKDGLNYTFVHRSFQEYFAAECAMHVISGKANEFLTVFAKRHNDTVFAMCYEIHPELVYDEYLSEVIETLLQSKYLVQVENDRKENVWICEQAALICKLDKSGIPYGHEGKFVRTKEQERIDDYLSLCESLKAEKSPPHAIISWHHWASNCAAEAGKVLKPIKGDGYAIRIVFSFEGNNYSISVRNAGERNFSTAYIRSFRAAFVKECSKSYDKARQEMASYFAQKHELLASLKAERAAKERSIDDILGI